MCRWLRPACGHPAWSSPGPRWSSACRGHSVCVGRGTAAAGQIGAALRPSAARPLPCPVPRGHPAWGVAATKAHAARPGGGEAKGAVGCGGAGRQGASSHTRGRAVAIHIRPKSLSGLKETLRVGAPANAPRAGSSSSSSSRGHGPGEAPAGRPKPKPPVGQRKRCGGVAEPTALIYLLSYS